MPRTVRWKDGLMVKDPEIDELFYVIRDRSPDELEEFIENNPNVELNKEYGILGASPLAIACRLGDLDKFEILYARGAAILSPYGSCTWEAASYGHLEILKRIFLKLDKEGKSSEEIRTIMGATFALAVRDNCMDIVDYLLENGADPNYQSEPRGLRPIDWARSPLMNLDTFIRMYPLTDRRYRKSARKNMEFLGFEQSFNRAKTDEQRDELTRLREKYDRFIEEFESASGNRRKKA